ncbi:MAG: hypothetical protein HY690_13115, partial [Chloroflexi bacterium]|nr:hypothetical protein [Chloroflexota bacterium]
MRFLRALADPTVRTNWVNGQGSSTNPDVLGTQLVAGLSDTVSLARMPAGAGPNGDALYLYWTEEATGRLWWSKATVDGTNYAAWSAPTDQAAALARNWSLATAPDPTNQAIIVGYYNASNNAERIARQRASADTTWTPLLVEAGSRLGYLMSLAVDGSHVYVFYQTESGQLVYRRYLEGTGWDAADRVVDSATSTWYPAARQEVSGGQTDVVYTRTNAQNEPETAHCRVTTSRPFLCNLAVSPVAPLAGQSTSLRYTLGDDGSGPLNVTATIANSSGTVVRTLSASQLPGAQSLSWDGRDSFGEILPAGSYTLRIMATDSQQQMSEEQSTSASVTRQASTSYEYDGLSRLIGVAAPSGATSYQYDAVGNR